MYRIISETTHLSCSPTGFDPANRAEQPEQMREIPKDYTFSNTKTKVLS